MIVAGIVGHHEKMQTANLINLILSSTGKKVSVIDSRSLTGLDSRLVKNYLSELDKNNTDILVLKLDISDAGNNILNDINFDVIVYTDRIYDSSNDRNNTYNDENDSYEKFMRRIFSMVRENGVLIVNLDESGILQLLEGFDSDVVTYGFNPKASITTSSVGDSLFSDSFICCLQKTISAKNGEIIQPQEYRLSIKTEELDRHSILAAAAFAIINGIDLNSFKQMQQ